MTGELSSCSTSFFDLAFISGIFLLKLSQSLIDPFCFISIERIEAVSCKSCAFDR